MMTNRVDHSEKTGEAGAVLSRRQMLLGGLATGTALTSGLLSNNPVQAAAALETAPATGAATVHRACASVHVELSKELANLLAAPEVPPREKNQRLKTTHCPHCQVSIAPADPEASRFSATA